jgi:hypothetical protein
MNYPTPHKVVKLQGDQIKAIRTMIAAVHSFDFSYVHNTYLNDIVVALDSAQWDSTTTHLTVGKHDLKCTEEGVKGISFRLVYNYETSRIAAIKTIRSAFNLGLKEAKDISDNAKDVPNGNRQILFENGSIYLFNKMSLAISTNSENFNRTSLVLSLVDASTGD